MAGSCHCSAQSQSLVSFCALNHHCLVTKHVWDIDWPAAHLQEGCHTLAVSPCVMRCALGKHRKRHELRHQAMALQNAGCQT